MQKRHRRQRQRNSEPLVMLTRARTTMERPYEFRKHRAPGAFDLAAIAIIYWPLYWTNEPGFPPSACAPRRRPRELRLARGRHLPRGPDRPSDPRLADSASAVLHCADGRRAGV